MRNPIKNHKGSSLVEVMVALLVTAIGMLGILSLHTKAIQLNQNAHLYSQATILANDIMESMKTTPDSLGSYVTNLNAGPEESPPTCDETCEPDQIARLNIHRWKSNIDGLLPGGAGSVQYNATSKEILITVQFDIGYRENEEGEMVEMDKAEVQLRTSG